MFVECRPSKLVSSFIILGIKLISLFKLLLMIFVFKFDGSLTRLALIFFKSAWHSHQLSCSNFFGLTLNVIQTLYQTLLKRGLFSLILLWDNILILNTLFFLFLVGHSCPKTFLLNRFFYLTRISSCLFLTDIAWLSIWTAA